MRDLVTYLEQTVVNTLAFEIGGIEAHPRAGCAGRLCGEKKNLLSLGLRIRRGCSFHGLSAKR